jgi:hypothetical protein
LRAFSSSGVESVVRSTVVCRLLDKIATCSFRTAAPCSVLTALSP